MDGTTKAAAGGGKKAVLPPPAPAAGSDDDGDACCAAATPRKTASLAADSAAAAAAAGAPAAAAAGAEEEAEDEQVERFYALLDNIRALRGAYGGSGDRDGTGPDGVVEAAGTGSRKRRLRGSEPPWRPAFRLEDFDEPSPTSSSDANKRAHRRQEPADDGREGSGARPAVASASASASASPPPARRAGVRLDSDRKSI